MYRKLCFIEIIKNENGDRWVVQKIGAVLIIRRAKRYGAHLSSLQVLPKQVCVSLFVCGTPPGRLTCSSEPKRSGRPTTWLLSISESLAQENALLIDSWRKGSAGDVTYSLASTRPIAGRRWWSAGRCA